MGHSKVPQKLKGRPTQLRSEHALLGKNPTGRGNQGGIPGDLLVPSGRCCGVLTQPAVAVLEANLLLRGALRISSWNASRQAHRGIFAVLDQHPGRPVGGAVRPDPGGCSWHYGHCSP